MSVAHQEDFKRDWYALGTSSPGSIYPASFARMQSPEDGEDGWVDEWDHGEFPLAVVHGQSGPLERTRLGMLGLERQGWKGVVYWTVQDYGQNRHQLRWHSEMATKTRGEDSTLAAFYAYERLYLEAEGARALFLDGLTEANIWPSDLATLYRLVIGRVTSGARLATIISTESLTSPVDGPLRQPFADLFSSDFTFQV